jgi:signal transduction histidine kinase
MRQSTDQEIIIAIIAGSIMFVLLGLFILSFIFFYKNRKRLHLNEKQIMMNSFQQELLQTQIEIQEQTLKHISQEIHDNIGQTLSLAKLTLNTIPPDKQHGITEKISSSKELVSKAIHDLRTLSKTMNTDNILSAGLLKAIEFELQQLERLETFSTSLEIKGQTRRIDPKKELILFRIVQEALTNTIKHSNASKIQVFIKYEPTVFQLVIKDNGCGFESLNEEHFEAGSGLKNMTSRTTLIGGTLEIKSIIHSGTTISISIPTTES